jgi:hypothetical protein
MFIEGKDTSVGIVRFFFIKKPAQELVFEDIYGR